MTVKKKPTVSTHGTVERPSTTPNKGLESWSRWIRLEGPKGRGGIGFPRISRPQDGLDQSSKFSAETHHVTVLRLAIR